MSYDIFFVRRDPGQSFEDALEDIEESYRGGDPGPLSSVDLEMWDAILPRAQAVLGEVEVFSDEATRELLNPTTGIQLSLFNSEVSITVPYWHDDEQAVEVMRKVYALAEAVEDETGLEGYDPQLNEPVSEIRDAEAEGLRAYVPSGDDGDRAGGSPAGRPAQRAPATATPTQAAPRPAAGTPRRHWWEFWKR